MSLSDRIGRVPKPAAPAPKLNIKQAAPRAPVSDPLEALKARAEAALFESMSPLLASRKIKPDDLRLEVHERLDPIIAAEGLLLTPAERRQLADSVLDNLLGFGPIQHLLNDPTVTEIMVNGPDDVYVERNGVIEHTDLHFHSPKHIRAIIERIVTAVGRRIDESEPMVDARMADGSRVNAVLSPLTIDSPTLTIRKFSAALLSMEDLVEAGALSEGAAQMLEACVVGRASIVISGGTGSGKTTLLNALSSFVPEGERIITIEDTAELKLQQRHVIRMETRGANVEGAGAVTIRDLVINALRMRPDRIVIGECRGPEAFDMLQAMNTGHDGSITTLHANSPRDALARLETMVLMTGIDLPHRAIREQAASAIDVIVQLNRIGDGSRRVVDISEVDGMEGDRVRLSQIYRFDWESGRDPRTGAYNGSLLATGVRPALSDELANRGVPMSGDIFTP